MLWKSWTRQNFLHVYTKTSLIKFIKSHQWECPSISSRQRLREMQWKACGSLWAHLHPLVSFWSVLLVSLKWLAAWHTKVLTVFAFLLGSRNLFWYKKRKRCRHLRATMVKWAKVNHKHLKRISWVQRDATAWCLSSSYNAVTNGKILGIFGTLSNSFWTDEVRGMNFIQRIHDKYIGWTL